jgi:ribosomal protein S12 methylthiotransferase
MAEVLREARLLTARGTRELVLIAQDTTSYGVDIGKGEGLASLLTALADVRGAEWIRLMYAYPAHFPVDILPVMRERANICRYLDMPVQHINDEVLRSMRRGITRRATLELLARIRAEVPGIALRTTLIVGYPNETDAAFRELLDFVREIRFERLGVFLYSQEENTVAHLLGDPVPAGVKEERRAAIMELQSGIAYEHNEALVGHTLPVLFDRVEGDNLVCRTEFDAPEVDNEVLVPVGSAPAEALIGSFGRVTIESATEYDLHGRLAARQKPAP